MDIKLHVDLGQVARDLNLPIERVRNTVALLDEGNTVPFVTRYRKDQTGGLDEEQIRSIQNDVAKLRQLAERKQTILKSIEAQGKLTPELTQLINSAHTIKRLEDLYLPYKPKKQSLATVARQRGLEPLAKEILSADPAAADRLQRAAAFVSVEQQLATVDDVLTGVRHIIAEEFSERPDLRGRLRRVMHRHGVLVSTAIEQAAAKPEPAGEATADETTTTESHENLAPDETPTETAPVAVEEPAATPVEATAEPVEPEVVAEEPAPVAEGEVGSDESPAAEPVVAEQPAPAPAPEAAATEPAPAHPHTTIPPAPLGKIVTKIVKKADKHKASRKDKKRKKLEGAFKDYHNFRESVSRVPHHRVLAINRGERAKMLRVKLECDGEELYREAADAVIPAGHPHTEFLQECLRDALSRLLVPSLEREVRRELTEKAEIHAVEVFVRNLRNLLLQPPVRGHRILAVDPGFRSGCKLIALDEFGNVLGHELLHVIGKEDRQAQGRAKLVEMLRRFNVSVIAVGNGTACRETEQLVSEVITSDCADRDVQYVVVNEAGASVYSTSAIGREELPEMDATLRSSVSIGRRLLDPLSELVKIDPANIGVGMYQHDVKAKHLRESLDAVVESCVNYVGVDANTASPALLRYVSGLNQLTARRLYEYRREHGPFRNREQIKQVPGIGEASFVQAAGFLKIGGGDNPLDETWIHPESYDVTLRVLEKLGGDVNELRRPAKPVVNVPPVVETPAAAPESVPSEVTTPVESPTAEQPAVAEQPIAESPPPAVEPTPDPVADVAPARPLWAERAAQVDVPTLATELGVGELLLKDILSSLTRPGRDPRDDLPAPIFRRGIRKLDDLQPGMELNGTVLNVVDFGVFVDIGLSDSGLVHVSRLADRYIRDPHEVVGVGDVLKVWVVEVDKNRRRVSLTAIQPGTERPKHQRPEKRPFQRPPAPPKPAAPKPEGQGGQTAGQAPPRSGGRPSGQQRQFGQGQQQGKSRFGGQQQGGRSRPPKPKFHVPSKPAKPREVKPLTKAMEEGREPMRSFSDLLQFYEKKNTDEGPPPQGKQ